ncbi:MAG: AprI/Inh family metalloprotease inhibitor [Flavobacteriaceae bacterium]
MRRQALLTAVIFLAAAATARAQELAGQWELINDDGSQSCQLELTQTPVDGRLAVGGAKDCRSVFVEAEGIATWQSTGARSIEFYDAGGQLVFDFTGVGEDMLAAKASAGIAYLAPAGADSGAAATPEDLAGAWAFARSEAGDPICTADLSPTPRQDGLFSLTLMESCDDAITATGISGWNFADGRLTLAGDDGKTVLSFSETGPGIMVRDPAGSRPLFLIQLTE